MKKNKVKITLSLIIIMVLCLSVGAYAAYVLSATEVSYTKSDGTEVSVKDALDELYAKSTGINATMVSEDPYHFIGAGVRYRVNGQYRWRILFSDGEHIYITTEYVNKNLTYVGSSLTNSEINAELSNTDNWSQYVDSSVADLAYGSVPEEIYDGAKASVKSSPGLVANGGDYEFTLQHDFFDPDQDFDSYYIIPDSGESLKYSSFSKYTGYINPCYCRPVVRLKEGAVLTEQYGYYTITVP